MSDETGLSLRRGNAPTIGVGELRALALRHVGLRELRLLLRGEDRLPLQGHVPAIHVPDRRVNSSVAPQIPPGTVGRPGLVQRCGAALPVHVAPGDVLPPPLRQPVASVEHSRGLEQVAAQKILIASTRKQLNDRREQAVPGIGVMEALPRLREERFGQGAADDFIARDRIVVAAEIGPQARGMGEEVVERDGALVRRDVGEIFADGIRNLQPSPRLQLQNRGGGELLGNRSDVEDGVGGHPNPALAIRQSVPFRQHHLAILRHQQGTGEAIAF